MRRKQAEIDKLKKEIEQINVAVQDCFARKDTKYKSVQDMRVDYCTTKRAIQSMNKIDSEIKSLRTKRNRLCQKLNDLKS